MGRWVKAALASDIPDESGIPVELGDRCVALFQSGGKFYALNNICPHRGASLGNGAVAGMKVICPWHGWEFDLRTGNLAMSEGVESFPIERRGDEIWVEL